MRLQSKTIFTVTLAVLSLTAIGSWTDVDSERQPDPASVARGKALYQYYCENCHGTAAKGDGPTADVLKVRPRDLTRLSARNDGEFPYERVYRTIDGREPLPGHGRGQMPIWGLGFQEANQDTNQENQVRRRIAQMIAYLRSIQSTDQP